MGSKIQYKHNNWEFNALLKYSPWVLTEDDDEHYARLMNFKTKTRNSEYYSVSTNIGYYMTPRMKFFSEWAWNKYTQGVGDRQAIDKVIGMNIPGSRGGIENKKYQITFGIAYQF